MVESFFYWHTPKMHGNGVYSYTSWKFKPCLLSHSSMANKCLGLTIATCSLIVLMYLSKPKLDIKLPFEHPPRLKWKKSLLSDRRIPRKGLARCQNNFPSHPWARKLEKTIRGHSRRLWQSRRFVSIEAAVEAKRHECGADQKFRPDERGRKLPELTLGPFCLALRAWVLVQFCFNSLQITWCF